MRKKIKDLVDSKTGKFRAFTIRAKDTMDLVNTLEKQVKNNERVIRLHRLISFDKGALWEIAVQRLPRGMSV